MKALVVVYEINCEQRRRMHVDRIQREEIWYIFNGSALYVMFDVLRGENNMSC